MGDCGHGDGASTDRWSDNTGDSEPSAPEGGAGAGGVANRTEAAFSVSGLIRIRHSPFFPTNNTLPVCLLSSASCVPARFLLPLLALLAIASFALSAMLTVTDR